MAEQNFKSCAAFQGARCVASGSLPEVAKIVKGLIDRGEQESILIFDDITGELVEVDFRGALEDVLNKLEKPAANVAPTPEPSTRRKPGRPKLGVVSREVTLLPRHWDWLNSQPGGASVALRKLVEQARRVNSERDRTRFAQEAAYRFMSAMAGNLPGFEEAARALFAGASERFNEQIASWPVDIREYARKLAEAAFRA